MKARISAKKRFTKKELDLLEECAEEVCTKKMYGMMRRIFKSIAYSLNRKYGFGKQRMMVVLNEAKEIMDEYPKNEIFWEQLDRVCIDEIGIRFVREKINKDGNIIFDDDETRVFEDEEQN